MKASFTVGPQNKHHVEVFSSYWWGKDIVKVDGVKVHEKQKFLIWLTDDIQFDIGDEKHKVELKYNTVLMKSEAYLNGRLHVGCLFPQIIGYNAMLIAVLALILS